MKQLKYSFISRPKEGEKANGDLVGVINEDGNYLFYVIDVLGHGGEAQEVAINLKKIIEQFWQKSLDEIILKCHEGILGSRGAALFLTRFLMKGGNIAEFSGIGNIEIKALCKNKQSLPFSYDGTVGIRIRKINSFRFQFYDDEYYCIFTDGISGRFNLEEIAKYEPEEGVKIIIEKYSKSFDDASVILIKT